MPPFTREPTTPKLSIKTMPTDLKKIAITVLLFGMLFQLVGCGSVNEKPSPSSATTPPLIENAEQQEEVEEQLLQTMSEARRLGPANPLLLSTMYSLAAFYHERQEFEKAERIYQEALQLKEKTNGPEHQDLALILNQYAALLRDAQRTQEASALEHRARQIQASYNQRLSPNP